MLQISVVIPTYNRKTRLLSLLKDLDRSAFPLLEVIIVDSGDEQLNLEEKNAFLNLTIVLLTAQSSVCIQRNIGIKEASSPWIFLCDDDMEVPSNYLELLVGYLSTHKEVGAISGLVLQQDNGRWIHNYPITSLKELYSKYLFQLGIWGPLQIEGHSRNLLLKRILQYYHQRGNHISKAGWPVITDFSKDVIVTPIYGLGASLIRKIWLEESPYDEVLDRYGIGDNYGVAIGFPGKGIHILKNAVVYHFQEPINRLQKSVQYYRRALALAYFIDTRPEINFVKKSRLLWSLFGNIVLFILTRNKYMIIPAMKTFWRIFSKRNPYYEGSKNGKNRIEPLL